MVGKMNVPVLIMWLPIILLGINCSCFNIVNGFSTPSPPTKNTNDIGDWLSNFLSPKKSIIVEDEDTVKGFKGSNGKDEEYPYYFRGRLWFRPALVRAPSQSPYPSVVKIVSLFGWTVGGVVALEYDESPVGPYREYVTMGSVVSSSKSLLGQWGSRLYVSTPEAEDVCQQIWNVPAELASIQFFEDANDDNDIESSLNVSQPPPSSFTNNSMNAPTISIDNWSQTRVLKEPPQKENDNKRLTLPVLWTPSIKALWAPFLSLPSPNDVDKDGLPFNQLRLSAGALRLRWCPQESTELLGIPIGIGLAVDDVLIEISPPKGTFY